MRCILTGIARDGNGNIVPSSTITPYLAGTSTATNIYTTLTSTTAVNSVTAGDDGSFTFYVDRFDYDREQCFDIKISKTSGGWTWTEWTWTNVDIKDVVLGTYDISTSKTVTTNLGIIPKGVIYQVATTKTLNFTGTLDAGDYQIFSCVGTGKVTFGSGAVREVHPEWWYSGTGTWTTAIQAAFNANGTTGARTIKFTAGQTYTIDAVVSKPVGAKNFNIIGIGATLVMTGTGNALNLQSTDSDCSGGSVIGLTIVGPNVRFPVSTYADPSLPTAERPSLGAGIFAYYTYKVHFSNVNVSGFKYGMYLNTALENTVDGSSYFWNNQAGIYVTDGANANVFNGISVRENWLAGFVFAGVAPTDDMIDNCTIESNIPYYPDGPYKNGNSPADSVGVYIGGTANNIIVTNTYFENHQDDIYITHTTGGDHIFENNRHAEGTGNNRIDAITIAGTLVRNLTFKNIQHSNLTTYQNFFCTVTTANNIRVDGAFGFTFPSPLNNGLVVNNTGQNYGFRGDLRGVIQAPYNGRSFLNPTTTNPPEPKGLLGQGTTTATLDITGMSELFTTGLTVDSDTTITNINGGDRSRFFTLWSVQSTAFLRVANTTANALYVNYPTFTFTAAKQAMIFWIDQSGDIYQVGQRTKGDITTSSHAQYVGQQYVLSNIDASGTVAKVYVAVASVINMKADYGVSISSLTDTNTIVVSNGAYFRNDDVISFASSAGSIMTPRVVTNVATNSIDFSPALGAGETITASETIYLTRWLAVV